MAYRVSFYGMDVTSEEMIANTINDVEKFMKDHEYPIDSRDLEDLSKMPAGNAWEFYFPNAYKAIRVEAIEIVYLHIDSMAMVECTTPERG